MGRPRFILCSVLPLFLILPSLSSSHSCNITKSPAVSEDSLPLITFSLTPELIATVGSESLDTSLVESVKYEDYNGFFHGKEIISGAKLDIFLLCNHSRPAKWVSENRLSEEDKVLVTSYTYRQARNYSDPSSERFNAIVRLQVNPGFKSHLVYICEDIQDRCNSRFVYVKYKEDSENFIVKNFYYSEINSYPDITDFISERERVEAINKVNNDSCPMNLTLYYISDPESSGELWYTWHEDDGTTASPIFPGATQARENNYRLSPKLGERCVSRTHLNFSFSINETCPPCRLHEFWADDIGYPAVTLYNKARGHQRVFNVYFDLTVQSMYYESEQADDSNLTDILDFTENRRTQLEFYKGQQMNFFCAASATKFASGVIVLWGFPGNEEPYEAIPLSDDESLTNPKNGAYTRTIRLTISKELLDERNASLINITCLFPVWNTTEWVPRSIPAFLKDSEYPSLTLVDESKGKEISNGSTFSLNYGDKLDVSCVSTGVPLPRLSFKSHEQNLNFTITESQSNSSVTTNLFLEEVDESHEGVFRCVATSEIGEAEIMFELKVIKGLPTFVVAILITLSVAATLFLLVGAFLVVKYHNEQVDFKRQTEEVVRRFHDGFKDIKAITFASKAEYKAYELPLNHWDVGGTIIGKGAFGTVHKGFIRKGDRVTTVAVKTVNAPKDVSEFEASLKELLIMAYIGRHPHIVNLVASCSDNMSKRSLMLATEFCANGDLLSFIQKNKSHFCKEGKSATLKYQNLQESQTQSYLNIEDTHENSFSSWDLNVWALHIAEGMSFLESKKVLHGDLAARNVLLTENKIAKISDFGLSRQLTDDDNYTKKTSCPLPWKWMAIESLIYRQFSSKSDVWSYGITLYEIFSIGEEPWPFLDWSNDFVEGLEQGRRLAIPQYASQEMYEKIMLEAWRNKPDDRPSFEDIKTYFATFIAQRPQ